MKDIYWIVIIFIFASLFRFILLGSIPIGITGDELDYVLNAKAIALSGRDISGTWSPFSLTPPPFEVPKGEIPYLLIAPFIGMVNFSLFAARFPYALANSLFPVIIFLIVKKLLGKREAVIAGLIMAINPWSIYFGRTAYDTPLTLFFYFVGFYILLITKKWKILWSFPFFFIAFFGYVGTKVIFIPFVAISIFFVYRYIHKKKFLKEYLVLLSLCLLIFSYFLVNLLITSSTTRAGDLLSPNSSVITSSVIMERQLSINSPLNSLFSNKFTLVIRNAVTNYTNAFTPTMLFVHGEQTAFISLRNQGFFYVIDIIFIIIGVYGIFSRNKPIGLFLLSLMLIAPLPSALSTMGSSHGIRSSMLIPIFIIFISVGITALLSFKKFKYVTVGILVITYTILLSNFLNNYLFRHPIYASETFNFSARLLAKYIDIAESKGKSVTLITKDGQNSNMAATSVFKFYLFYTNSYNANTYKDIANVIRSGKQSYKNLSIVPCSQYKPTQNSIAIVETDTCTNPSLQKKKLSIARLSDGGEIYAIYDTLICKKYDLERYPHGLTLNDFAIEEMSEENFCKTYVTELL